MPIFEFECNECQEPFEELVRSTYKIEEITCPECGGHQVRKKISTFASKMAGGTSFSLNSSASANCGPVGT